MRFLSVRLHHWLARSREKWAEEQIRRRSMEVALKRFSKLHAHWHRSCFDSFFLDRIPKETFARLDAAGVAREWTRQFRYRDERQRNIDIRQVTPVAESFLSLLAAAAGELKAREATPHRESTLHRGECAGAP
jgi:hypothetical protein